MGIPTHARGWTVGTLAATLKVPGQSLQDIAVDLAERLRRVAFTEVVPPACRLPIGVTNEHRDGLEALFRAGHGLDRRTLACQRLGRYRHVQILSGPPKMFSGL